MKALILREVPHKSLATAQALIDKGFQILSVDTPVVAQALISVDTVDLLVMDERIGGQLSHAVALSGERKNPYLSVLMLTDRAARETDELFDLIPCLYGLAGLDTAPDMLAKLALSAVSDVSVAQARIARNARDEADTELQPMSLVLAEQDMVAPDDDPESGVPCFAELPALAGTGPFVPGRDGAPAPAGRITATPFKPGEPAADELNAEIAALFRSYPHENPLHPLAAPIARAG